MPNSLALFHGVTRECAACMHCILLVSRHLLTVHHT